MDQLVTPQGILTIECATEDVSDGYHTFGELYEHRCYLFAMLCVAHTAHAFKTRFDNNMVEWPGWFIAGINTLHGQLTYHLPERFWDLLPVEVIASNDRYDGHNSDDVLLRMNHLLKDNAHIKY